MQDKNVQQPYPTSFDIKEGKFDEEKLEAFIQDKAEDLVKLKECEEKIVLYPSKALSVKAKPITTHKMHSDSASELSEVLHTLSALGVAGNQIGLVHNICAVRLNLSNKKEDIIVMLNPRIVNCGGVSKSVEGCLSFPNCPATITRSAWVEVTWEDIDGFTHTKTFRDYDARIIQHEIDHLNGITILDKMHPVDKMNCRFSLANLEIRGGVMPKKLAKKGIKFKTANHGTV